MSMENLNPHFYVPISPEKAKEAPGSSLIKIDDLVLRYTEFDDKTSQQLLEEASAYELHCERYYWHEDDVYNCTSEERTQRSTPIPEAACSPYSPIIRCLVVDGHFAGIILHTEDTHGGVTQCYKSSECSILYIDGKIVGNNKSYWGFTGSESSSSETKTYTLRKRSDI